MFENGTYLRRRKRFKLLKTSYEDKKSNEKTYPGTSSDRPQRKSSFFIDNLLGNDTNTSYTSSSSETNSPTLKNLFYSNDWNVVQKLAFLSDMHGQKQQVY